MFINKIGYYHIEYGINCQDFGIELNNKKIVLDGCSQGLHSEVGVKLFAHLYKNYTVQEAFCVLTELFSTPTDILNYLCFTILSVYENEDNFITSVCGDGYIIKQKLDNTIEFEKFDYEGSPPYYIYNYINSQYLKKYQDGVDFLIKSYSKKEYKNIGIATDGIEYILNSPFKEEFEKYLIEQKAVAIKRLINRENKYFKDDITIAF